MWLDTLYMIGSYSAMYAHYFGREYLYEKIYHNMNLMRRNMTDPATGLLYHAWDDSKDEPWADAATGLSREFWGRAIGWYAVAILDILDFLPANHPRRQKFIDAKYAECAHKGYSGVIRTLEYSGCDLIVPNICVGTLVGDYDFYINRPTVQNDLHGTGAFLLMCTEYYSAFGAK